MSVKALAISCWLAVAAVLGVVCFFSDRAEGAEVSLTGYINDGTKICEFNTITPDNVEIFDIYKSLIDKLEDVGIENLTKVESKLGAFLTFEIGCGTLATDYRIYIFRIEGDYALFLFDIGYGFEAIRYLMLLESFHADEVL